MSEPYPWGNQAPPKRVAAIDARITANDANKAEAVKRHREEIRKLDDTDRGLKSDLRTAQAIVERERSEANAAAATRLLMKVLSSTGLDVEEAIRTGTLEKAMADAFTKVGSKSAKGQGSKTPASPAPPADPAATDPAAEDKGGETS